MIYLSEVRKSPEGLAFNEAPSLLESIKERYDQVNVGDYGLVN